MKDEKPDNWTGPSFLNFVWVFLLCRYYGRNGLIKRLNRGMERLLKMLGEHKGKIKGMKTQKKGDPLDLNKLQVRHSVHSPTLRLPRFFPFFLGG